jgi:hypothetical protein
MNIYYDHDKLGVKVLEFDEDDLSYEYNTALFVATTDGRVFFVSDSGCSCPTPFEYYNSDTLDGILAQLERVGSLEQAERLFDSWNAGYSGARVSPSGKDQLRTFIGENLKS